MERLGKYEIIEKIGEGGFGVVYKGRDPYIKRIVAIKTCSSDDEGLRKRFLREAEVVGTLQHPNITMVHDFGYEGDVPYLVQEFLTGEDLSALISRDEPLTEHKKLDILLQAARGLAHAHEKGVVHRDVKPNNIRVLEDGKVKVMDFGIAKLAQLETKLTKTGMSIGTAAYMSPEQLNGDDQDHRCDIFAFGAMAYELLANHRPFDGQTMSRVVFQILYEQPKPLEPEQVPYAAAELDALVRRCMAKDPAQRYSSLGEVIGELERLTGAGATRERPIVRPAPPVTEQATTLMPTAVVAPPTAVSPAPGPVASPPVVAAPRRSPLLGVGIGAAIVVAALGGWLLSRRGEPTAPPPATANVAPPPATTVPTAPVPAPAAPAPSVAPPPVEAEPEPEPQRPAATAPPPASRPAPRREPPAPVRREPPAAPAVAPSPAPPAPPAATAPPQAAAPEPAPAPPVNPAPAPTQAPTAPAQPPPRAAGPSAEDGVREALRRYEAAYESLDARAVRAVWPGLGDQRQRDLQKAFDAYRSLEFELRDCSITVTGDTAQAQCGMRQSFQPKVGEGARREAPISFRLRRQGEGWRIESLGG